MPRQCNRQWLCRQPQVREYFLDHVRLLDHRDELDGGEVRALVEQLVERVLPVGARLFPFRDQFGGWEAVTRP